MSTGGISHGSWNTAQAQLIFAGENDSAARGVIATGAEILFGLLLLVGWHTRATALLSGLLLLSFGVAMTLALGVKAPLNFAVFTGVGGACFSQIAKASHSAWMSYCSVEPFR